MVGTCFALERRLGLVAHGVGRTGQLQLDISAAAKEGGLWGPEKDCAVGSRGGGQGVIILDRVGRGSQVPEGENGGEPQTQQN